MPTNTKALQVAEPAGFVAGKNAVINGGMDVWQRGTSFSASGTNYTADRWCLSNPSTNVVSRSTDVPSGFSYSLKWDLAGSYPLLSTYVELPVTGVKGQYTGTWTVSFWAKGSTSFSVSFEAAYQDGSSRLNRAAIGTAQTVALTTTWTKYTYTFDLTSASINSTNKAVELIFYMVTGANSMYLTGFQFESGPVATPFSRAGGTIQGELAACQRYYQQLGGESTYQEFATGQAVTTTTTDAVITFPVTMRAVPTVTFTATTSQFAARNASGTEQAANYYNATRPTTGSFLWRVTVGSGLVAGNASIVCANNSNAGRIYISAEL